MWCSSCQSEVAAKVSTDNNKLFCATCGKEINISEASSGQEKTREAQDLLQRWSEQTISTKPVLTKTTVSDGSQTLSNEVPEKSEYIKPKTVISETENHFINQKISDAVYPEKNFNQTQPQLVNVDHPETVPFQNNVQQEQQKISSSLDIQSTITRDKAQNTNWVGFFGQLLAYGGVATLTLGTCMVLLDYFGGKEGYAPQGWLITTVGQMALLLGIVTLVSCGIEHSSQEVTNHIASLDERIMRIEQAALARFSAEEKKNQSHNENHSSSRDSAKAS